MESLGVMIPILAVVLFFGSIMVFLYFFYQYKNRRLEAVVKIVESGGQAYPELIKILDEAGGPISDMRKGAIWLAIGIPLTIGIALEDGIETAAFGSIAIFIGFAYLFIMKFGHKQE